MARDEQDMAYAAIDVGTTSIKAVLFDRAGRERVVARASVGVCRPQAGWAEQDMHAVWHAIVRLLSELAQTTGHSLAGLAITAQGDGCWLADERGEPVRPAILWNDGRAGSRIAGWLADGTLRRMLDIGHFTGFAGTSAAILPWLSELESETLARAATAFTCGSWIYRRLTGQTLIDPSDAAVPFMSAARQVYDDTLLELSGISHMADLLPPIAAAGRPVHGLMPHVAAATGLPAGLPVVLAPYDVPAAALGAGCVEPGDMLMVLGTTFLTGSVVCDGTPPPFGGTDVPLGRTGARLRFFPALAGMETLSWAARTLGFAGVEAAVVAALNAGARGAVFLPYLSPAGERSPFVDPHVRGGFAQLSLDHAPENLMRAVLEGLTMTLLDCARASGGGRRIAVCGGGANSDGWCQLLADATGMEVYRPESSELSARGASISSLAALHGEDELAIALQWRNAARVWKPNLSQKAHYDELYGDFLAAREASRRKVGR
jgi:xylulokinase